MFFQPVSGYLVTRADISTFALFWRLRPRGAIGADGVIATRWMSLAQDP